MEKIRNVFIINGFAGKKKVQQDIIGQIKEIMKTDDSVSYIYTKGANHATEIARAEAEKGDKVRLYFCGGDGTLNEGLNGAAGFDNVDIGCVPCGTGNDYIKEFPSNGYSDIKAQLNGESHTVDLVKVGGRYSMNICSVGMDAEVAAKVSAFKKLPLIRGTGAYIAALLYCFLYKIKFDLTIQIDDNEPFSGTYLFTVAANAKYYGGGFFPIPAAKADDGELNFLTIKTTGRAKILSLLPIYKQGRAAELTDLARFYSGKKMKVSSKEMFTVNLDGECFSANEVEFEILPRAARFIIPR